MTTERLHKLYYALPVWAQNLAVSAKGLALDLKRKRGKYSYYKNEIKCRNSWNRDDFKRYSLHKLNSLISYAINHVDYYKDNYKNYIDGTSPISEVNRLPIISRQTVKRFQSSFLCQDITHCMSVHTTGTTGSPLEVICDKTARQKNYAFFDAYLESIGIDYAQKHIILGGRLIVPIEQKKPPYWRHSLFQKSLLMSSYHLSEKTASTYIEKIIQFKPEYIESYPSTIYLLATYMLNLGIKIKIKAIITSAETLFPEQRNIIESAFGCTVYDQYGCVEMAFFAGQCKHGKYHLRPDYGITEVVGENGNLLADGEIGSLICTGFINNCMPLIRYSIGDRAAISSKEECECGLNTPVLLNIEGRMDDFILTGDGRKVGRLSPVLKGYPVVEAQYLQYKKGEVEVQIVPTDSFKPSDCNKIRASLNQRLGDSTKITISMTKKLNRGRRGKLKSVISYL